MALYADLTLSRRLERTEGLAGARFVEAHARLEPGCRAQWMEVAGALAMFDGPASPITQSFGLGLFAVPSPADLDRLEGFFRQCGAPAIHEVSPLAGHALMAELSARGYRPVELTSVMFRPLPADILTASGVSARRIGAGESGLWAQTAAEGWRGTPGLDGLLLDLMRISVCAESSHPFLAEIDGTAVAAGSMWVLQRVALMAGASTVPEWRNRGAQRALLEARLRAAAEAGCDLAMMCAAPGSASQRNAERQGFRIAYTRIKWALG